MSGELNLKMKRPDHHGRALVIVSYGDKVIEPCRVKIYEDKDRREFSKRFCAEHGGIDESEFLERLVELAGENATQETAGNTLGDIGPYEAREDGLYLNRSTDNGIASTRLANFCAKIKTEIIRDDGTEDDRLYEIEVLQKGRSSLITVPVSQFTSMRWPLEKVGTWAIVEAGFGKADHLRVAILTMSEDIQERRVYTHTGWKELDGAWAFLHGGGAIGSNGNLPEITVSLGDCLDSFQLPDPPEGEELRLAVLCSLAILDLAPARVTIPSYASLWRSVLVESDLSLFLVGPSGAFKSELAALLQQHFGPGFVRSKLPCSWSSTDNALEMWAFRAMHALLVIDDFAPTGTQQDIAHLNKKAERLFRAQGNNSGRLRMWANGLSRPAKPPRGMICATGEDLPRGLSLRARLVIVEIGPDDIDPAKLTACQQSAAAGRYAQAMSGFLRWLAPRIGGVRKNLSKETFEAADSFKSSSGHRRTPMSCAHLYVGFRYFVQFAQESGVLDEAQSKELLDRAREALTESAASQQEHQHSGNPALRFMELLASVFASGQAHVMSKNGTVPETPNPEAWGWRSVTVGSGSFVESRLQPLGTCVGWIDGDDLYLDMDSAFQTVQRLSDRTGEGIAVTSGILLKRLNEQGFLKSTEKESGGGLRIRRNLAGARRRVVHLRRDSLSPPEKLAKLTNPAIGVYTPCQDSTYEDAGNSAGQPAMHKLGQDASSVTDQKSGSYESYGQNGQVGQLFPAIDVSPSPDTSIQADTCRSGIPDSLLDTLGNLATRLEFENGLTREEAEIMAAKEIHEAAEVKKEN